MGFTFGNHGIGVNVNGRDALLDRVRAALRSHSGFAVATLNLDHLVKLRQSVEFTAAYAKHGLVVADGRPVAWLSRLSGHPVELAPGSDLVLPLCKLSQETGARVGMVGSTQSVLHDAAARLCAMAPGLNVCLTLAPSRNFDPCGAEAQDILTRLRDNDVQMCFLALGAPKQELFAALGRDLAPDVGFVSIGAGLDFVTGQQVRAPAWMRALAMEWVWRMLRNPLRMAPRYAKCFAILPSLAVLALRARLSKAKP